MSSWLSITACYARPLANRLQYIGYIHRYYASHCWGTDRLLDRLKVEHE